MNIAAFTYQGTQRSSQQDAILVNSHLLTDGFIHLTAQNEISCFVADGVGRSTDGAFASQFVLNQIRNLTLNDWEESVQKLRYVNRQLINENMAHAGNTATTLSGCVFTEQKWILFQAGDSSVYLIRKGKCMPLVSMHNERADVIRKRYPGLSAETIYAMAANTITSYFGGTAPSLTFDTDWKRRLNLPAIHGIQQSDTILICSDGLFKSVSPAGLLAILKAAEDLDAACREIRLLSETQGAEDNVSMILIDV